MSRNCVTYAPWHSGIYIMCMQIFLDWCLTFTRSVEQRQHGGCSCPCAIPAPERGWVIGGGGAMPYHWAHFSANSACLQASEAPSAEMLPVAISLAIQL